ncbi:hypothetical protein Taro_016248, partial [Colocasia esculenta]|nr:hypothetical protein [Colocasia esculenta]
MSIRTSGVVIADVCCCRDCLLAEVGPRDSSGLVSFRMEGNGKRVLVTSDGDVISKGIAFHLARLVLMGDLNVLESIAKDITSSLGLDYPIEVVGLDMAEEKEAIFDEAVDEAWKILGSLDAFVNCYVYE